MKKIITITWEFEPGDRVMYVGSGYYGDKPMRGRHGTVIGESAERMDYLIMWDGWDHQDDVDKADVRPIEQP